MGSGVKAILAVGLLLLSSCTTMHEAGPRKGPLVIAHRGGALLWPENTLPAFREALAVGVDVLEFDMVLTADDRVLVSHDPDVNPQFCLPGPQGVAPGPVRAMTLAQAQDFDCGSRHRAIYPTQKPIPGTRMPSLEEVLEATRDGEARYFAEMKMPKREAADQVDPDRFAASVLAIIDRYGVADRVILQSFDFRTLDAAHRLDPRIRTCLLGLQNESAVKILELVRQHHASCVVLRRNQVEATDFTTLKHAGVTVFSEVVDTAAEWQAYTRLGVDGLFTNDPVGAIEFLKQAGLRW